MRNIVVAAIIITFIWLTWLGFNIYESVQYLRSDSAKNSQQKSMTDVAKNPESLKEISKQVNDRISMERRPVHQTNTKVNDLSEDKLTFLNGIENEAARNWLKHQLSKNGNSADFELIKHELEANIRSDSSVFFDVLDALHDKSITDGEMLSIVPKWLELKVGLSRPEEKDKLRGKLLMFLDEGTSSEVPHPQQNNYALQSFSLFLGLTESESEAEHASQTLLKQPLSNDTKKLITDQLYMKYPNLKRDNEGHAPENTEPENPEPEN